MREVADKVAKLKKSEAQGKDTLKAALKAETIPVVQGPGHVWYMTDHHHFARAVWEAGIEKLFVTLQADWSAYSVSEFWKKMQQAQWVYLEDQFGHGRHTPEELPVDVRGMGDDPYRSLSRAVRKLGGYEKSNHVFAEFLWADFLRTRMVLKPSDDDVHFANAVKKGAALAHSPEAKALPGYVPETKAELSLRGKK